MPESRKRFRQGIRAVAGEKQERNLSFRERFREFVDRMTAEIRIDQRAVEFLRLDQVRALATLPAGPMTLEPDSCRQFSISMETSGSSSITRMRLPFSLE